MVPLYSSFYVLHSLFDKAFLHVRHPMYYPTYLIYDYILHPIYGPVLASGTHYNLRIMIRA